MQFDQLLEIQPAISQHSVTLLESYRQLLGHDLVNRTGSEVDQAVRVYELPAVVLSHDGADDPIFTYANLAGQKLFEYSWDQFLTLHSRQSAEADQQETRSRMLADAQRDSFIRDYSGIRISASGKRFQITNATIWSMFNAAGQQVGQAAVFDQWAYL